MVRNEWVGGKRPSPFVRPASGYLADAGSGRLLGLLLDSIPTATGEAPGAQLSPEEIEWADGELERRAADERGR